MNIEKDVRTRSQWFQEGFDAYIEQMLKRDLLPIGRENMNAFRDQMQYTPLNVGTEERREFVAGWLHAKDIS